MEWSVVSRQKVDDYIQLSLAREVFKEVVGGTIYAKTIFASVIEGDNKTFMVTGERSHHVPNLSGKETIKVREGHANS